jgi:putative transposase
MNLARMIGNLKTVSARLIRKEFAPHLALYYWKNKFWNNAYAVVSAGGHASIEQLVAYIQDQDAPPA